MVILSEWRRSDLYAIAQRKKKGVECLDGMHSSPVLLNPIPHRSPVAPAAERIKNKLLSTFVFHRSS